MSWQDYAAGLAQKFGLPQSFLDAIIQGESGGNTSAYNFNPAHLHANGSYAPASRDYGLLQLNDHGQGAGQAVETLYNPERNLDIGVPPIAAAYQKAVAEGKDGFDLFLQTVHGSGHTIATDRVKELYDKYVTPMLPAAPGKAVATTGGAGEGTTPGTAPTVAEQAADAVERGNAVMQWLTDPAGALIASFSGHSSSGINAAFVIVGVVLALIGIISLAAPRAGQTIINVANSPAGKTAEMAAA